MEEIYYQLRLNPLPVPLTKTASYKAFEQEGIFSHARITFRIFEDYFKFGIERITRYIKDEASLSPQTLTGDLAKLYCIKDLAYQAFHLFQGCHKLFETHNLDYSLKVLHRALFDTLLKCSFIRYTADSEIYKRYIFFGTLSTFKRNLRYAKFHIEKENYSAALASVQEALEDYDSDWLFGILRSFNVIDSDMVNPIIYFVKDESKFREPFEQLKVIFRKGITCDNSLETIRLIKLLTETSPVNLYNCKYDWSSKNSEELFKEYEKNVGTYWFGGQKISLTYHYDTLFRNNSNFVHTNITNAAEEPSDEAFDVMVYPQHLLLIEAFEKLLHQSGFYSSVDGQNMHERERELWQAFKRIGLAS